jgi:hypothetical protein
MFSMDRILNWMNSIVAIFSWLWLTLPVALHAMDFPPEAVLEEIHPEAWKFSWRTETEGGPVALYGVYWKLASGLQLIASAGQGRMAGNEEVGQQARRLAETGSRPLAAANADFFVMTGPSAGSVHGVFIRDGVLLSKGRGPTVVVMKDGSLKIEELAAEIELETEDGKVFPTQRLNHQVEDEGIALFTDAWGGPVPQDPSAAFVKLRGEGELRANSSLALEVIRCVGRDFPLVLEAGEFALVGQFPAELLSNLQVLGARVVARTRLSSDLPIEHGVGGLPIMVREGVVQYFPGAKHEDFVPGPGDPNTRHPRTAFGANAEYGVIVVADGRAPGHSVGMTIPELGEWMRRIGCTEAVNLDGGGSSTLWAMGNVLNRPSGSSERPVGNALILIMPDNSR